MNTTRKLVHGIALAPWTAVAMAQAASESLPVDPEAAEVAAPPEASAPTPSNRFVEEIVVTAQKREENLQDVPISISAFSGDSLDARGVQDQKDLQLVTPGLQYGTTSGFSVVFLRGIGTDAFIPSADASVATYIDGVYFPFTHSAAQSFGTVERVEVLKGPQGTLFGRNSTGGAISVITKQPDQTPETSMQFGYARFDELSGRVYTNIPLTDTLAWNVSALYSIGENYYTHLTADIPDTVNRGVRTKLRWSPNDVFDWTVTGYLMRQTGADSLLVEQLHPKPALALLNPMDTGEYETAASQPGFIDANTRVVATEMKVHAGWLDLKLIGSAQDIDTQAATDFDATEIPVVDYTAHTYAKVQTGELQLLSNDESWGHEWLTWIGGVYWIHSRSGFDPIGLRVGPNLDDFIDGLNVPAVSDLFDTLFPGVARVIVTGVLDTKSTAGFFQTSAAITDWLKLTVGGRYQEEKRYLVRASSAVDLGQTTQPLFTFDPAPAKTDNFSPKAVLDFQVLEDAMLYASWSTGFKSGTFNIVSITTEPNYVKPEKVTTTELGVKSTLLDGALRLNGAVFNNKIKDLQSQVVSLQSGASVSFETAGAARIRGADFDLLWEVAPDAIPGLVLTASGCYLDSKYTDYRNGSGYDDTTGLYFGTGSLTLQPGRDFTGNEVVRTPEFTGNLGLSYTFAVGNSEFEIAADAYRNTGFYYTPQNTDRAVEDKYTVVNARASWLYQPWDLRVTLFGKNINDGDYFLFNYESDFGTSGTQAPPAIYGVRLNWDF